MEATRREIDEDLAHYKWLYEAAPVPYFIVDFAGHILEGNVAGAELVGHDQGLADLSGRRLQSLLAPASWRVLIELLRELREGASRASREVQSRSDSGTRTLRIVASAAPARAGVLLVIVPLPDRSPS